MRLAAIQVEVTLGVRASNLRAALKALELAADAEPSPDLCVLPAMFDLVGDPTARSGSPEALLGPTAATLSFAARDLGVYLIYGIAAFADEGLRAAGIMLDADGDRACTQYQVHIATPERRTFAAGHAIDVRATPVGKVAMLVRDDVYAEAAWAQAVEAGAEIICGCLSGPATPDTPGLAAIAELAKRFERWAVMADVCVADGGASTSDAASGSCIPPRTGIVAPDGRTITRAPAGGNHVCAIRTSKHA